MKEIQFTFKRAPTFYGLQQYAKCKELRNTELCFAGVHDFFDVSWELAEFTLVFSEGYKHGAYLMSVTLDPDMNDSERYTIPTLGGHDICLLGYCDAQYHLLWNKGYNYVRLEYTP